MSPRTSTVALCVTGSIAAFKAVELARLLVRAGIAVVPVMTASASHFIGPLTLAGVCGEGVHTDMWQPTFHGEVHVQIATRSDVVAIVPATADILARLAHGRADDLVTAIALCARGPVVLAPAMHPRMWQHPATRRNVQDLNSQGRVTLVGPTEGEVASGEFGFGRMAEPEVIADRIHSFLVTRDLVGLRLAVTAGPTFEDLDPVRFIGNRSSGKMGFATAERAAARGAAVTLIAGPVSVPTPPGVRRIDVRSALAMQSALWQVIGSDCRGADALVMAAAVADHRPGSYSDAKLKKGARGAAIELVENPDILAEIGAARGARLPVLVGFAVETTGGDALIDSARRKLAEKRVDLVVANEAADSFGRDDNRAVLVTADEITPLPAMSKNSLADAVLDRVRDLWRSA